MQRVSYIQVKPCPRPRASQSAHPADRHERARLDAGALAGFCFLLFFIVVLLTVISCLWCDRLSGIGPEMPRAVAGSHAPEYFRSGEQ